MRLVRLVLVRFFLQGHIVEIKSILDLCDLRIWKLGPFLRIILDLNKNTMFLSLRIHQWPGFLSQCFVGVFELMDLLRTANDIFQLPSGLTVAQVLPFDHVEMVHLDIQVKAPHVRQVDMVVWMLHEFFSIVLIVKPMIAELPWIKLLQLLFGSDILSFLISEEDIFLVKLLHIQIISLLFNLVHLSLFFLFARATLFVLFILLNDFWVWFLI